MDEKLAVLVRDIKKLYKDAVVYLFGSRAKGTATKDSDYDIIVISNSFGRTDFVDRGREIWLYTKAPMGADLLCYTPQEFNRLSKTSVLIKDALTHAIAL